jgi:RNA polymerase sigma factor (sigma-70 family)
VKLKLGFSFGIAGKGRTVDFRGMDSLEHDDRSGDMALAGRCLDGEAEAIEELRRELAGITPMLLQRGASAIEAEDLLQALWADCVSNRGDRPPLLELYNGKCSLRNWLLTIATHRLYDILRRHKFRGELPGAGHLEEERGAAPDRFDALPAAQEPALDSGLTELLCGVLQGAFGRVPAEELLMLRLVFLHELSQKNLCHLWGVSEATISRRLTHTLEVLQQSVLEELRSRDAALKLDWNDFEQLCNSQQLGFL